MLECPPGWLSHDRRGEPSGAQDSREPSNGVRGGIEPVYRRGLGPPESLGETMSLVHIRKTVVSVETVRHEGGPRLDPPLRVGTAAAVVANPYAGRFEPDLLPMMAELKPLGKQLARELVEALGGDPSRVEGYGKGAIVGVGGELEHGALWHEPGGWGMRKVLGGTKAIVPSCKMVGVVGARLMVPMGHVNAAYVRSHMNVAELSVHDAPRPDEILFALVMTTGPRVHARIGGLAASEIAGEDGLR